MEQARVLVVEDDDTIRRLLVEYLKIHSYLHVEGARDGAEALHQISTERYAVIILDLLMPHMSGVDFLSSLEAMSSTQAVKPLVGIPQVVVITGAAPSEIPSGSVERRFSRFVHSVFRKPLDMTALADCVESLIKK